MISIQPQSLPGEIYKISSILTIASSCFCSQPHPFCHRFYFFNGNFKIVLFRYVGVLQFFGFKLNAFTFFWALPVFFLALLDGCLLSERRVSQDVPAARCGSQTVWLLGGPSGAVVNKSKKQRFQWLLGWFLMGFV